MDVNTVDMEKVNRPYHHGQIAQDVLLMATKVVREKGADGLSLRACAREIGVDPAAVYRHYKGKDDILLEIGRNGFSQMAEAMEAVLGANSHGDDASQIVEVGHTYVRFATSNPNIFTLMFKMAGDFGYAKVKGKSNTGRDPYEVLRHTWSSIAERHDLDPAQTETAIFALWSYVHGLSNLFIQGFGEKDGPVRDQIIRQSCKTIIAGFTGSGRGGRAPEASPL